MKKLILILFAHLFLTTFSFSQTDVKGSKDHEIISRYEGAWIIRYDQKEYDIIEYPMAIEMASYGKLANTQKAEGTIWSIEYRLPTGITSTQVFRNYQAQLRKSGMEIRFECEKQSCGDLPLHFTRKYLSNASSQLGNSMIGKNGSYLVAKGNKGAENYTILLIVGESNNEKHARYRLDIIKEKQLDSDKVTVADMTEAFEKEGKFTLYGINFKFNSAEIQDLAHEKLEAVSSYLKQNSTVNVFIVGHTDNVGSYNDNLNLSQKRAEAIVDYLIKNHSVDKNRLTPIGISMVAPVASNKTEEGRALNRRVEVVVK